MKCSKKVNGECGKALNCVWCPEHIEMRIQEITEKEKINSRKKAIRNHRKMWNWIADNQERICLYGAEMKRKYFLLHKEKGVLNYCYLCDYTERECLDCSYCPIDWDENNGFCSSSDASLYSQWKRETDFHEAAKLAREIANLPERVVE